MKYSVDTMHLKEIKLGLYTSIHASKHASNTVSKAFTELILRFHVSKKKCAENNLPRKSLELRLIIGKGKLFRS